MNANGMGTERIQDGHRKDMEGIQADTGRIRNANGTGTEKIQKGY